jgi:aspartate kinase
MVKDSIVVVKFGGSCLESGEAIGKAADHILNEYAQGKGLVVVVSALNGMTDRLISLAQSCTNGKVKLHEMDEILAMGERTCARLMMSSLNSKDMEAEAVLIDPESDLWPIYTNSRHGDAEPDILETRQAIQERILPLINENKVIVFPGFLGKDKDTGKITTLGRNGSDTTAVLLGNCLDASEVILVKDVEGVYSYDPKKVNATLIDHLDVKEVVALTSAGTKVIHDKALRFKLPDMNIRIVGFHNGHISKGGTIISGAVLPDLHASLFEQKLQMITIVGNNVSKAENVHALIEEIQKAGSELAGASLESGSVIFYATIPDAGSDSLVEMLHEKMIEAKIGKAITNHDDLALITISGRDLETTPGIIERISYPFTEINLYGFLTINSNIRVFVNWNEKDHALDRVKESLNLSN